MIITTTLHNNRLSINLIGELDECTADTARKKIDSAIINNPFDSVVFDMKDVGFMDSTGIGVLLGRYNLLKKMGVPCYIRNCSQHIDRILTMSGVYRVIKKVGNE